jgi:hypothetical protein
VTIAIRSASGRGNPAFFRSNSRITLFILHLLGSGPRCWLGASPYATLRSRLLPPDRSRALPSRRFGPL